MPPAIRCFNWDSVNLFHSELSVVDDDGVIVATDEGGGGGGVGCEGVAMLSDTATCVWHIHQYSYNTLLYT